MKILTDIKQYGQKVKVALDSPTVQQGKRFVELHESKIRKGIKFTSSVITEANTLLNTAKSPTVLTYAVLASRVKTHFDGNFREDIWSKFAPSWERCLAYSNLETICCKALTKEYADKIAAQNQHRCLVLPDQVIGWYVGSAPSETCSTLQCETGKKEQAFDLISKALWKTLGPAVILGLEKDRAAIFPDPEKEVIHSKRATEIAQKLSRFLDKKVSRTVLFYGPPGTGKSNIVRSITDTLQMKCLKFNILDFKQMGTSFVNEVLNMLKPDVVVIEDIDHAPLNKNCQVLAIMELLNKSGKLILATTNEVSSIDVAMLRPGRFDELIEIDRFDEEILLKLVGNDKEIYEIIKDFPIASTMELMKRISVLGKTEAIASMDDITKRYENLKEKYNCKL